MKKEKGGLFSRKAIKGREETMGPAERLQQTIFGVRFPWECVFFVVVGLLSEVVDAMFMNTTLDFLNPANPIINIIISYIVGAGCFFSMAFAGFQLGNRRYYSKLGIGVSYGFWALAGIALVTAKLMAGLVNSGELESVMLGRTELGTLFSNTDFISAAIVAVVQLVLYIGTGFMTRDSVRILTDNDMREFFLARRTYKKMLDELSDYRGDILCIRQAGRIHRAG